MPPCWREREKKKEKIKYFFKERRERSLIIYIYIYLFIYRILLMCAFKTHIKSFIFRNIFLGIEKVLIVFSIFEKYFQKYMA